MSELQCWFGFCAAETLNPTSLFFLCRDVQPVLPGDIKPVGHNQLLSQRQIVLCFNLSKNIFSFHCVCCAYTQMFFASDTDLFCVNLVHLLFCGRRMFVYRTHNNHLHGTFQESESQNNETM